MDGGIGAVQIQPNDNSASLTFDAAAPDVAPCPGQLIAPASPVQNTVSPLSPNDGVENDVAFCVQWTRLVSRHGSSSSGSGGPFGS